ncbi:NYN domain-containing protein [Microbispora sp. H13382]|uniref:NYN domain-containing protein n=1 Tax=Microbispora sp. H13382 TaxID=2729112 RepID=UPI00160103A8|nr:NYN domain-containing protein [Microbispora sp. H13382]
MLTNVYVDGFNLYYGCLRGTPYKWLDLDALAHRLVRQGSVHRIRYFTAMVTARPDDPGAHKRQDTYLRALLTIPHLTVHFGRFQERITRMPLAFPTPGSPRTVEVVKTEEKGSDVNLATYLLLDAFRQDCDSALVVSNDADLAEPIRVVRHELGIPIGVANPYPYERRAVDLIAARPTFLRQINPSMLKACQLPDRLQDAHGKIRRPDRW